MSPQEIYGLFLLGLMHGGLALWVYNDIKLRQRSMFWVVGTFLAPEAFFPFYFWNQRPELTWTCPQCNRQNQAGSRQCGQCNRFYTSEETIERLRGHFEPSDPVVISLVALLVQELIRYMAIWFVEGPDMRPEGLETYVLSAPHFWLVKLITGNVLVWLCLYCITARYRRPIAAVGLRYNGSLRSLGLPLLLAPALALISVSIRQGFQWFNRLIPSDGLTALIQWEQEQLSMGMPEGLGDGSMILLGFVGVVLLPVAEEILFRGIAHIAFAERFGRTKGILISSLFFAVLHGSFRHFTPLPLGGMALFLMGLVLAWLFLRTRSLIPCMLTHSLINLILFVKWFGKG
ncbi:MAG: CPBP family glutamic-type intramembrane protease [Candidatus Poribacteria bacterium]|nr:CPBP family glutamic-type intramembrane protease [Candidatus Poribacteria bacterium]